MASPWSPSSQAAAEQLARDLSALRFASSLSPMPMPMPVPVPVVVPTPQQQSQSPLARSLSRSRSRSDSLTTGLTAGLTAGLGGAQAHHHLPQLQLQDEDVTLLLPAQSHRSPAKKKRIRKVDEAAPASMRSLTPAATTTATSIPTAASAASALASITAALPRPPNPIQQQKPVPARFSSLGLLLDTHTTSPPPVPPVTTLRDRPPVFVIPPPPAFSPPILSPPAESPVPPPSPKTIPNAIPEFSAAPGRMRPQRRESIKYSKSGSLPLPSNTPTPNEYNFLNQRRTVSESSVELEPDDAPTRILETISNTIANSGPILQSLDSRFLARDIPSWQNDQVDASDEAYLESLPRTYTPSAPLQSRTFTLQSARTFKPLPPISDASSESSYNPPPPPTPARDAPTPRLHNSHPEIVVPKRSESMAMFPPLPSTKLNIAAVDTGLPPAWIPPQALRSQTQNPALQSPPFAAATLTRHGRSASGSGVDLQRQSRRASAPNNMHDSLSLRGKNVFSRAGGIAGSLFGRLPGSTTTGGTGGGGGSAAQYQQVAPAAGTPVPGENAIAIAFSLTADTEMHAARAPARELESDYLNIVKAGLFRSKPRSQVFG
ncbi:hypothetical protein HDU83_005618 [Entophlyctis luteolus]|nr:hypothetical protein HDU83_005618 [Entophlyctis luteolus]